MHNPSALILMAVFGLGCGGAGDTLTPTASPTPSGITTPARGGPLPPLFPPSNWWNLDVSRAPVDAASNAFINFVGASRQVHPDFGGIASPGSDEIYGIPYVVVGGGQPKVAVSFEYSDESDGVDHQTNRSFPFYPIPP